VRRGEEGETVGVRELNGSDGKEGESESFLWDTHSSIAEQSLKIELRNGVSEGPRFR